MKKLLALLATLLFICSMPIILADEEEVPEEPKEPKAAKGERHLGILNAMERGNKTIEEVQHLQDVLTRITEHKAMILEKLENLTVEKNKDGNTEIKGKKEAKLFGLLRLKHQYRFEVDGEDVKEKGWFKWAWKDIK